MAGVRPAGVLDKVTRKEGFTLTCPRDIGPPNINTANPWFPALIDNPRKPLELTDFCHTPEWPSD